MSRCHFVDADELGHWTCSVCRTHDIDELGMVEHVREVHGGGEFTWLHRRMGASGSDYARALRGTDA